MTSKIFKLPAIDFDDFNKITLCVFYTVDQRVETELFFLHDTVQTGDLLTLSIHTVQLTLGH